MTRNLALTNAHAAVVQHLRSLQPEISQAWINLIFKKIPDPYGKLSRQELAISTSQGISAILDALTDGKTQAIDSYIEVLSKTRIRQDFSIQDITRALMLARQALVSYLREGMEDSSIIEQDLDEVFQILISRFALHYAGALNQVLIEKQQQAHALSEENERLYLEARKNLVESQSLQRVMAALLQEHTLDEVLNIVCTEAISLTGSHGCTISLLETDGWLKPAFSLGEGSFSFNDAPIASPLLEMTLNTSQVGFTLEEDQGCLLVVPLRNKGKIIGTLTIFNKSRQFSDEDLRIVGRFTDPAAIAIENARLYQQVERVAIIEERNRLARELHDSVTQSLYAVTLYAEAATRLLSSGDLSGANDNLKALSQTAQEAVKEMRLLIFELRPPVLEKEGLVAAIQARMEAVEGRAGLKTELVVNLHDRLTPEIEETYYRIIQEALNNILKHSQAQKVSLTLIQESDRVILEIIDDGVGFDLASVNEKGGFGLKSMSERAEKYNCKLKINSAPGKGTHIHMETRL
jgi:signal transduction histidine kinase